MEHGNYARLEIMQKVKNLVEKDYSYKAILHILQQKYAIQISLRTLQRIMEKMNLRRKNIVESPPALIIAAIILELDDTGCNLGYRALWKRIRKLYKLVVKQETVLLLLRELDPEGVEARRRYKLKRRTYTVPGPNFLWHSDNHDKLKRFGFPMYGFIDGFSRKVLSLKVMSSNNRPQYIANQYLTLVKKLECVPTRLRTDKGSEANIMGDLQRALRFNHGDEYAGIESHKKGKSTNNQRIESYWRQFRQHLGQFYMDLFKGMVEEGLLVIDDIIHIECLRFCFGNVIQEYVNLSRKEWNEHHVRKQNGRNVVSGKPNELYCWPEKVGKVDCRKPVNMDHVNLLINDEVYSQEPYLCSPHFVELVDIIMPGTSTPSSNEEALDLYQKILENVKSVLEASNDSEL